MTMKTSVVKGVSLAVLALTLAGCTDPYGGPNYTGSGALIGAGSGALLGAAVGGRHAGAGALIGGAAGLVTGSLIGHSMDEEKRRYDYPPPAPPPPPAAPVVYQPTPPPSASPSINDIKNMSRAGVSDDTIISQIISTHSAYTLSADAIIDLKGAGVSERVINAMIATGGNVVVPSAPPEPQSETIIVSPGPDYYWVRGEWVWNGHEWIWVRGHYLHRPYYGAVWVEARWVRGPRGWYRTGGYWR
jgi:Glycine zipper